MRHIWPIALTLSLTVDCLVLVPRTHAIDDPDLSPPQTRALAVIDSLHLARNVDAADSLLAAGLAAAQEGGSYELELLVRRGRLYTSFGQSPRGAPILVEAIDLAEARGDSLNLARAIRWLSLAEGIQGRSAEAGVLYRRLQTVAVAHGDSLHEGWALVGLGWEALNGGRLDESRAHYERAVALFAGLGNHDAEIWASNGYALVLQRQGDYPAALALYRELTSVAQRTGYTVVEAMACNNTGSLLQKLGDPGAAIPHYERARELQLAAHQPREAVIPSLNIAVCLINQNQFEEAAALLHGLDRHCVEEGFPDLRADVLYELSRVRSAQNRLEEAAALHRRIGAIPGQLPVGTHVRNITGLARVLAEMDSTEAALAVIEQGRTDYLELTAGTERLMLDLGYGERLADAGRLARALAVLDAVAVEAAATGLTGYRISARTRGGGIHLAQDRPDSALAWFRLAAAAWEAEREVPLDPRWREQRGTYGQLIYPQLARLLLRDDADPSAAYDAVHGFKARTLSEAMLGPGAYAAPEMAVTTAGTGVLRSLQESALRPGELFLDYYLGPEGSFVFAATPATLRAARLPALPELEALLRNYRAILSAPQLDGDDGAAAAHRVAEILFHGVKDLVATSTAILWAPDGPLHRIPLATLPAPDTLPAGTLLAGTHTITRLPSALALLHLRSNPGADAALGPASILAVAGTRGRDGFELAGPVHEAEELRDSYASVRILVDPEPEELLTGETGGIIHLAAHAVVDPQHPWRSAFVLGEDPETHLMSAGAIARQRMPYGLAVLASCESVGSLALVGEGQLGLSSAFLGAGVPTVVATLWPVPDRTALAFARSFYASLADGQTVAEAMQGTRILMRGDEATAHPGDWAGFVLVGDGDVRFRLERANPRTGIWWLLAAVLVTMGAVWWFRSQRGRRIRED